MWYIGSKKKCEEYNDLVTEAMNIGGGVTQRWSEVVRHAEKSRFAVVAHENYPAKGLKLVNELTEDWYEYNFSEE